MTTNGGKRSGLLTAGGVLSIVAGVFLIGNGVIVAVIGLNPMSLGGFVYRYPMEWFRLLALSLPESWLPYFYARHPFWLLVIIGGCATALGIIALVGGISSVRRMNFGLSLAGAICAIPSVFVGILAVILVCLGRREFKAKEINAEMV